MQLCGAYCGYGHFAIAPVCSVYDTPTCGGPVAEAERRSLAGASTDGGTSAAGIPLPMPAPVASDARSGEASSGSDDVAHVDPPLMRDKKPSGCVVTDVRRGGSETTALGLVLLAWLASRARRRSPR
jgi:MYXO-CTERM domain-containing protein